MKYSLDYVSIKYEDSYVNRDGASAGRQLAQTLAPLLDPLARAFARVRRNLIDRLYSMGAHKSIKLEIGKTIK